MPWKNGGSNDQHHENVKAPTCGCRINSKTNVLLISKYLLQSLRTMVLQVIHHNQGLYSIKGLEESLVTQYEQQNWLDHERVQRLLTVDEFVNNPCLRINKILRSIWNITFLAFAMFNAWFAIQLNYGYWLTFCAGQIYWDKISYPLLSEELYLNIQNSLILFMPFLIWLFLLVFFDSIDPIFAALIHESQIIFLSVWTWCSLVGQHIRKFFSAQPIFS